MKKLLMLVILLALAGFTAYKLLSPKPTVQQETKEQPLSISKNSDHFNASFSRVMDDYYILKDAFVEWDSSAANHAAVTLQQSVAALQLNQLKADSTIIETAQNLVSGMDSELKGLEQENSLEEKRQSFNALTDELYNLIRVVRYDRQIIYHIKCPMAFKDSVEAYWLSNTSKIVNPYLGKKHPTYKDKMLGCGEVVDSLDFSKK